MKDKLIKIVLVLILSGFFVSSGRAEKQTLEVFVSVAPQKYFVKKIGGDLVHVRVLVMPGESPAIYEPKPRQMAALSNAEIYFAVGVPFENVWMKKITASNREMLIVHTEKGVKKKFMKTHNHYGGDEIDKKEHSYPYNKNLSSSDSHEKSNNREILDPHIWTSPRLVKIQAKHILEGLSKIDPANRLTYELGYKIFMDEVQELDRDLRKIFEDRKGLKFMVFHPAWYYFADDYGIKQIPVEIQGKEPKPAQLYHLIKYCKKKGIKIVFVQPEFSAKSAQVIAKGIGGEVAFVSPLAEAWSDNLRKVAVKFKAALR